MELAKRKIRDALVLEEKNCRAYRLLGIYFHKLGDYPMAITAYKNAQEIHPSEAELVSLEAFARWNMGNVDDAIIKYKQALKMDSLCISANDDLGVIYYQQNRPKEALEYTKRIDRIDPENLIFKMQLAATYLKLEDTKNGLKVCRQMIKLDSTFAKTYYYLGGFYMLKNDTTLAKENFLKFKKLDPAIIETPKV